MVTPTPTATATATANPRGAIIAAPVIYSSTAGAAMPATVSSVTGSSVIAAGQNRSAAHNALVLGQAGRKVSGGSKSKCKSKRSKRSKSKSKRSKCKRSKSKCKHSNKRSKRRHGGEPSPSPTPSPSPSPSPSVMPVPQFAGAHNDGANTNSVASNRVLTHAAAQTKYDNPNAPASNTKVV